MLPVIRIPACETSQIVRTRPERNDQRRAAEPHQEADDPAMNQESDDEPRAMREDLWVLVRVAIPLILTDRARGARTGDSPRGSAGRGRSGSGLGEEGDGLVDPLVGLGATEAEEAAAGVAEALAAQAGDAERVVGPFQQVQRQAVRGDPQAVADRRGRRGRRRTCPPAGRPGTPSIVARPAPSRSTLRRNRRHVVVAGRRVVLERGLRGQLDERRAARGRRVDQLADRLDDVGMRRPRSRSASRSCCTTC